MDRWMKNNNFNKILALALAVLLWAIVHMDDAPASQPVTARMQTKVVNNVKIQTVNFDSENYVLASMSAETVKLEVRGQPADLSFAMADDYKITADLDGAKPGESTIALGHEMPRGVELISMTPSTVRVKVEMRISKTFPVSVVTKGSPAKGYQTGAVQVEPETAEVTLADSALKRIAKVQGVLELDGQKDTVTEKVKLVAYDKDGKEVEGALIEPETATVTVPVTLPFKSVPLEIGLTGELPGQLVVSTVTPELTQVVVYGPQQVLDALNAVEANLNLSRVKSAGTTVLDVALEPPEGTERIEPQEVKVTVETSEIAERTLDDVPVTIEGIPEGMQAAAVPDSVSLTLSGSPGLLADLEPGSVTATADVSGLSAGSHRVELDIRLPRFVSLGGQPEAVTVELRRRAVTGGGEAATPTPPDNNPAGAANNAASEQPAEPAAGEEVEESPTPAAANPDAATPAPSPSPSVTTEGTTGAGAGQNAGSAGQPPEENNADPGTR